MNKILIKNKNNQLIINSLKGAFVAVSITLVSILTFAFIIKITNLSDKFIAPINQIIKIVSVFFGCKSATSIYRNNGLIKGIMVASMYTIISFLIFSALSKTFSFSIGLLYDFIFSMIVGAICGVFSVNIKK